MLILTILGIAWIINLEPSATSSPSFAVGSSKDLSPKERLQEAERFVLSDSHGQLALGNTDEAKNLAHDFAIDMTMISNTAFTEGPKRTIQLSGGNFLTYCELHEDSCIFIAHVPSYRDYEKDAKRILAELAWIEAVDITKDALDPGDKLAVALKGTFLYGDIMVGTHPGSNKDAKTWRDGESDDLVSFFQDTITETLPEPEIASDMASNFGPTEEIQNPTATKTPAIDTDPFEPAPPSRPIIQPTIPSGSIADTFRNESSAPDAAPTRSKPEEPEFVNTIPVNLLSNIDAKGWTVKSLIFTRRGNFLIAGRLDQTISIFDVESHKKVFETERLKELNQVVALAPTRDNQHIIVGGYSGAIQLWTIDQKGAIEKSKSLHTLTSEVTCLTSSPSHDYFLAGDRKGSLAWQPYDDRSTSVRTLNELTSPILAVYLPNASSIAFATDGKNLIHFSLATGQVSQRYTLKTGHPYSATFSPDGIRLAVSFGDEIHEFATDSGKSVSTLRAPSSRIKGGGTQRAIVYHPTQPWLISGGNKAASVWDMASSQRIAVLDMETTLYLETMAFAPDGQKLAIIPAAAGQAIKVFEFEEI